MKRIDALSLILIISMLVALCQVIVPYIPVILDKLR